MSLAAVLGLCSCASKHVPQGRLLLWENNICVNGAKGAPSEAEGILKQQPVKGPNLAIYNMGNGRPKNFFSKIGEAPVILDSAKTASGASQLRIWYFNNGYFNATSSYRIDSLHPGGESKKAEATYYINTGDRFYIKNLLQDSANPRLTGLVNYFSENSYLKEQAPYDAQLLDKERDRLAQIFRNHGYFDFAKNYITFQADTFLRGDSVNLKMFIAKKPVEVGDTTVLQDHEVFHINEIYVRPDQSYSDSVPADTLIYKNYKIVYDTLRYNPRYLYDAIHFKPGDRYEEKKLRETYNHLVGYRAFQLSEVVFRPAEPDSAGQPTLNAYVNLSPMERWQFTIEPEVTNTSGNFGANGSIGVLNRNTFGGGEQLEFRLNAGLEYQPTIGPNQAVSRTLELGAEVSLLFPRFLLPFNSVDLLPKRMQPKSRIALSASRLSRIEFDREILQARLSYLWNESQRKFHQVDLVDFTYSRLFAIQDNFRNQLTPIQAQAFQSELIPAVRYTYTLNEQLLPDRFQNPRFFKGSLELAGNSFRLLDQWTNLGAEGPNGAAQVFDVQYFQYGKVEADFRYFWNINDEHAWVQRIFTGYILPWGNSVIDSSGIGQRVPPFSKYFFMGGSNDLRAWPAYRVGAGRQFNTDYAEGEDVNFATGTFKFLASSEYRFPMVSSLNGAVFIDAGNVWYTGGLEDPQTDLTLKSLVNELAVGTGFGLRLDLSFFVIRFDVGMKVRDPALIGQNKEWVIFQQPNFIGNWSYNVALGYPF